MTNRIIIFSSAAAAVFLVAFLIFSGIIKCPYKSMTGVECLFCGSLTSFLLVLKCRLGEAWHVNPAGVFAFTGIILIYVLMFFKTHHEYN